MPYFCAVPTGETYQGADSLTQIQVQDTVYGIENEQLIPIRHTEVLFKSDIQTEKLYDPTPLKTGTESWQVLILVIAVLLLGMVKAFSNNRYKLGLKALFKYSVAQEITREEHVFFHRSNVLLTFVYLFTLSLILYQLKRMVLNESSLPEGLTSFFVILGGVIILYISKFLFSKMLLFVFNDTTSASEYIFNVSLYNNLMGVLLIPILCITYFTAFLFQPLLVYIVIPLALLVFLLRLIRLFLIGRSIELLYVYIFLYICTLEILPLVVLYRIFVR